MRAVQAPEGLVQHESEACFFPIADQSLHFRVSSTCWGAVLWGRQTERGMGELVRSLAVELRPTVSPHVSLVDASRVEAAEPRAFELLAKYVEANTDLLGQKVRRLALARPSGMAGALVAGFFEVLPKPYPVATFAEPVSALTWLREEPGFSALEPSAVVALLGGAVELTRGGAGVLARLRAWLDAHVSTDVTLAETAVALVTSERTLQRRLAEANTTLSEEIARSRVREAKRLMLERDESVTTIAHDVGCASLQHLGQLFRRFEGVSPKAWRAAATKK